MESMSQPQKKSNIPIIAVIVGITAGLCGAVILCSIAGMGFLYVNRMKTAHPTLDSSEPIPTDTLQSPFESLPTEASESLFIPTAAVDKPFDSTLPQGGRGDNALRKRVWDFVVSLAEDDAGCKSPLPAAAIIVTTEEPDSSGVWEEAWALFCDNGSTPIYRIIFTPNSDGNINFSPGLISK
jgi:hypothetical protein